MEQRHGGFLLVDTLIAHGITDVFGMPGGQANAFYDALGARSDSINHILIRDETTAVFAADAFSRVNRRIGVCDATVGPGSSKLLSGLMEAYNSSVPILVIISDHPQDAVLLQEFGRISQGGDQLNMLKPFAKETFDVPSVDMLPKVVAAAIHTAVSGRPGPVVLQVPQNVFNDRSEVNHISGTSNYPKYRSSAPKAEIKEAVQLLRSAKRPFVLAGGGTQLSGAYEEIGELLNKYKLPVATTLSGKGIVPETEELCLGVLGELGSPCAKVVADQADVILAIGYKHSQNTSYRWTWPKESQKLIHIDIDTAELGRVISADIPLWGDAKETLKELLEELQTTNLTVSEEWLNTVKEEKGKWVAQRNKEASNTSDPIWPQSAMGEIHNYLSDDVFITCDAGFSSGWAGGFLELIGQGRQIILPRGAAGLGFSLPAALGVSIARPDAKVIAISGDGAFSYNVGELATLKQLNTPIVNVIFNNSVLSWSKWTQTLNFEGRTKSVELGTVDFAEVAAGYDIFAKTVTKIEDLAPTLEKALQLDGPSVINVITDEWQAPTMAYREAMEKAKEGSISHLAY